jgi:hypothetical protein
MHVPFQKLGQWAVVSFPRFLLVGGLFWGIPQAAYLFVHVYSLGTLSAETLLINLAIVAFGSLLFCLPMWVTVVVPLKEKLRQSDGTDNEGG